MDRRRRRNRGAPRKFVIKSEFPQWRRRLLLVRRKAPFILSRTPMTRTKRRRRRRPPGKRGGAGSGREAIEARAGVIGADVIGRIKHVVIIQGQRARVGGGINGRATRNRRSRQRVLRERVIHAAIHLRQLRQLVGRQHEMEFRREGGLDDAGDV